jgi:hypothetical protein
MVSVVMCVEATDNTEHTGPYPGSPAGRHQSRDNDQLSRPSRETACRLPPAASTDDPHYTDNIRKLSKLTARACPLVATSTPTIPRGKGLPSTPPDPSSN